MGLRGISGVLTVLLLEIIFVTIGSNSDKSADMCKALDSCKVSNDSNIVKYCSLRNATYEGPCCVQDHSIVGLDLKNCNVSTLEPYRLQLTSLRYLSLQDSYVDCSKRNFIGMVSLERLWLSDKCNETCPGNSSAWQSSSEKECINQTDSCVVEKAKCPTNAECDVNGPGLHKCVCQPGYYGYKCLDKGEFPVVTFAASLTSATVVTSVALWFVTLRKTVSGNAEAS